MSTAEEKLLVYLQKTDLAFYAAHFCRRRRYCPRLPMLPGFLKPHYGAPFAFLSCFLKSDERGVCQEVLAAIWENVTASWRSFNWKASIWSNLAVKKLQLRLGFPFYCTRNTYNLQRKLFVDSTHYTLHTAHYLSLLVAKRVILLTHFMNQNYKIR